ncbi:MAG: hypothetical protein O7J95_02585, partial [Planctomycetota bacterium]|nr:hypothetical protein [Planctomycetota bacterium]
MRGRKLAGSLALVTVAVGMCLVPAVSQDSGREGRGQEDGRGDRGRRDRRERGQGDRRDEFRRRFSEMFRERLGAS